MRVLKFGGTSVGNAQNMQKVFNIIKNTPGKKMVVLSAVSGVTNLLTQFCDCCSKNDLEEGRRIISQIEKMHLEIIQELLHTENSILAAQSLIEEHVAWFLHMEQTQFSSVESKKILAQGEILSTNIFSIYAQEQNVAIQLFDALDFMRIDREGEPDLFFIEHNLKRMLEQVSPDEWVITQGFISRNQYGEWDNLQRGGSDYTATLIGAVIKAEEIQIWTDIDGMHNNDPRVVNETHSIKRMSFDEAAELAYFGAKILHPLSIHPAQQANVPVRIKNTFSPEKEGTLISADRVVERKFRAVAAKDQITAVRIRSARMLMAYGFLRKVFDVFERFQTPIDLIATSEVSVNLTIDDSTYLKQIVEELNTIGEVEVKENVSIVCVVGDLMQDTSGQVAEVLNCITNVPILMVSYGGSENNISFAVESQYKSAVLSALNNDLFTRS